MGESEEELERREEEAHGAREEAILDEATAGAWLGHESGPGEDGPPAGELPDNPSAPATSLWSRIMRALRGN